MDPASWYGILIPLGRRSSPPPYVTPFGLCLIITVPGGVAEAGWKSEVGPLLRQVGLGWRSERRTYIGEVEGEDLVPAEDQPSILILPVSESSSAECHTWSGTGLRLNLT